jgi:hypothetical protein
MADGFGETFQDRNKPGRSLLQTGAGLLQTRRPNKSEEDLLGHFWFNRGNGYAFCEDLSGCPLWSLITLKRVMT